MTGFETVLLRVAGTAASALVKSLLSRTPGAGLTPDPARPSPRWRKPPTELGEPEVRRLAGTLAARMTEATARTPDHERLAAVAAVGDAFAALGPLDAEALFAADLDPDTLAAMLPPPPPGLGEPAESLYGRLVRLCCEHTVEYLTTLPGFAARADVELVRRTGELARAVDRLAATGDGTAYAFEERYAQYIAATHGRLQLFGLTTGRAREEWPLDLAYISLTVSGEQQLMPGEPGMHPSPVRAEHALGSADRVLLRGPAGSGKSTLMQWLALNAARQAEGPWAMCVPFVLRLRAFTTAEALPSPEEFLRASGVPLSAPAGWTEDLMLNGRALVLVDGVDEVPQRLRTRTEAWLRSLIAAFPKARYVVTTRPSAVPEDWLAGQGFTPHSLLPMELDDIRAFVSHWHRAARAECPGEDLDAYEASLLEAVSVRRDLTRLATNPLMCALLCALNRDRRMHLPRARKEVYDAALDMFLIRRDTEREISGVEGVHLTRDEQVALLQRFAYWLIRNGQVEADRDEAVEMVAEWLHSMPQVAAQGGAAQVFTHLLIRSGLLLEPVPGSVVFVHRTFQDYLGAKAAVESRDFGVLVKNAHDDTWDDVVRMAVGHARPEERTRLLRGLLKRADRVKGAHNRLILLAATCLEHAPELDPSIHSDVRSRTAELLPPFTLNEADELGKVGELVLDLLQGPAELNELAGGDAHMSEAAAAATIRTAAVVGTPRALEFVSKFRNDLRFEVCHELSGSWRRFDAEAYTDAVLTDGALGPVVFLQVHTADQLAQLPRLRHFTRIRLEGKHGIPPGLLDHEGLEELFLASNPMLDDLSPLSAFPGLKLLGFDACTAVDLRGVRDLPLETLYLYRMPDGLDLTPIAELGRLSHLGLDFAPQAACVEDLPLPAPLAGLGLYAGARHLSLRGIEAWNGLEWLTVTGPAQATELARIRPPGLRTLQLLNHPSLDPASLARHGALTDLYISGCTLTSGLEPLRELQHLTHMSIHQCGPAIDLTPLADLDQLRIDLTATVPVLGTGLFPPGKLRSH
ncbi:NACHT domain-containing protein [Streptomyces erythrochromogenes]|uniref:NACHT domain-containing protein n=1 Tax=Streptomyces erythrochromogenes TaxID=285574 RepID=UPI0038700664|nr:NACHT domain-containing protein [Streptomyces erythrochromogenes]